MNEEKTLLERFHEMHNTYGESFTVDDFAQIINEEKKVLGKKDYEYSFCRLDKNTSAEKLHLVAEILAAFME